jgi:ATP-dependent RNA helicase DeaD
MVRDTKTSPVTQGGQAVNDQRPFARLGVHPRSVDALASIGIETPTPIQERAIPPLLAGRDVIGQSRTGSGKTMAFGLPLVERIDPRMRAVQALVIVPTRELAAQVADAIAALDSGRGLRVAQLIGGRSLVPQADALRRGAQIAVGAPGRIIDHLRRGNLRLDDLRVCVLDEADQMLDAGFAPDVERIIAATPKGLQMALFTATLPDWALKIAGQYLKDPVRVDAGSTDGKPAPAIEQTVYLVPEGQRLAALCALLDQRKDASGTTLVFGRTKHGVKKMARQLEARGYPCAALQGNMSQNARDRVVAEFRAGQVPVLLATNVAARGLDVLSIEQVINYELPESAELFTHRVGRTGRMEREGEAITLVTPSDLPAWRRMQRELRVSLPALAWPQEQMPLPVAPPAPEDVQPQREQAPRRPQGHVARRGRPGGQGMPSQADAPRRHPDAEVSPQRGPSRAWGGRPRRDDRSR